MYHGASDINRYLNDFLDCVQNTVTSFCGAEAGSWQRELETRLLEPLMEHALCQLHDDGVVYYDGDAGGASSHGDDNDGKVHMDSFDITGACAKRNPNIYFRQMLRLCFAKATTTQTG